MTTKLNKVFHFATSFKAKEDEDCIKISGLASTNDLDRAGDVIVSTAWDKGGLENYKKNPIVLFNHDYNKPIGRVTSLSVSDKGLQVEAKISKAAGGIQQLIKDSVVSTFSVGFSIKDADYIEETDGLLIKDVELYEISVVSLPCNQNATFSVAKSFEDNEEREEYFKQFGKEPEESKPDETIVDPEDNGSREKGDASPDTKEIEMTPEEIQKMIDDGIAAGLEKAEATRIANEKATQEAQDKEERLNVQITTAAERLVKDLEDRLSEKDADTKKILDELQNDIKEKAEELDTLKKSKRVFADRGDNVDQKELEAQAEEAFLLGIISGKRWDTKAGKAFAEKAANPGGGVEVPNLESWETLVSTNIERDIQHALVLAPLFREIQMNSAVMKFPVLPDAGYAEFTTQNANVANHENLYKGNLDERGAAHGTGAGIDLIERVLTVNNIKSVSYLGNEVEEDAIMPIMPLIRESIIRSHARTIENSLLVGGTTGQGALTGAFNGLAYFANTNGTETVMGPSTTGAATNFADAALDGASLLYIRKSMGKYGMRPGDVVYIVNERGYYELIEDGEWQDVSQVGPNDSMKLKGAVGKIYGSEVIVCDEFAAPAAAVNEVVNAIAVNTRNFLMPRLRGLTVEAEYKAVEQHRAVIATQRLGFDEVIATATAVASLSYPAA